MDDAERGDEQRVVAEWTHITPLDVQFFGDTEKYARITVL